MRKSTSLGSIGQAVTKSERTHGGRLSSAVSGSGVHPLSESWSLTETPVANWHRDSVSSTQAVRGSILDTVKRRPASACGATKSSNSNWSQHLTVDGRIFFHDGSSGISQWHIPNSEYRARSSINWKASALERQATKVMMPSDAKALLGVDCLVYVPAEGKETLGEWIGRRMSSAETKMKAHDVDARAWDVTNSPEQLSRSVTALLVKIIGAKSLRDTDFMPGVDKSDAYVKCGIVGNPDSNVQTHVVQDDLDPVWNTEFVFPRWEKTDNVFFEVWDFDEAGQTEHAEDMVRRDTTTDIGKEVFRRREGDDFLGKAVLVKNDFQELGQKQLRLEASCNDQTSTARSGSTNSNGVLNIEVQIVTTWPSLVGMRGSDALALLEDRYPHLQVQLFEI